MMRSVLGAAGAAVAALAFSQAAVAQDQPPNKWVMHCTQEGGRDCGVQATIDGNSLLGQFLVVRYSAAYRKFSVVGDGMGQQASIQVDYNPFISTSICGQGICQFDDCKSGAAPGADAARVARSPCSSCCREPRRGPSPRR